MSDLKKIWECTIFVSEKDIPNGADFPPREAAINAVESLGLSVTACTSGWGCEEFTPKIAKLKTQNQQLKQRIEQLEQRIIDLDEIADTAFKYNHSSGEYMRAWHKLEQLRKGGE